jgi:hypothetical protein
MSDDDIAMPAPGSDQSSVEYEDNQGDDEWLFFVSPDSNLRVSKKLKFVVMLKMLMY